MGAAPASSAQFAPCAGARGLQCTAVTVPLDRSGVVPGAVALHVERLPARRSSGALLVLVGGPGQSATGSRSDIIATLGPAITGRDLILIDQRGTGRSGALRCAALASTSNLSERAAGEACASEIGAARDHYTSLDSALDIEVVRGEIGVERLAIFGVSYGTRLAQEYARRFPTRVEALVLDSAVPVEGSHPFNVPALGATNAVLRSTCGRGACRGVTTNAPLDLARLLARLRARSLRGVSVDRSGRGRRMTVTENDVLGVMFAGDFDGGLRGGLPGAVRSALRGDAAPLVRLVGRSRRSEVVDVDRPASFSTALFAATTCSEEPVPWDRAASPDERARQASAALAAIPSRDIAPFRQGAARAATAIGLCTAWPVSAATQAPPAAFPDVPVLVVSGALDLRTPLSEARRVAGAYPRGRTLVVPGIGHSVVSSDPTGCAVVRVRAFLRGASVGRCSGVRVQVAEVAPTSLAALRNRLVPGASGRTLLAAILTIGDVADASAAGVDFGTVREGGLRGGSFTATRRAITLRRVSYVPGVSVSGRLTTGARGLVGRLIVRGAKAVSGTLRVGGGRMTGTLGGTPVDVPFG